MKTTIFLFVALALGQSQMATAQVVGYAIAGPAGNSGRFGGVALQAAGGGEFLKDGTAGVSGEVGILANTSSALSVMSLNGVVHFLTGSGATSPYLTGGYSRFSSGEGNSSAWNFGVGADFWRNDHAGARVEFRDHVRSRVGGAIHYFTVRAGLVLK
ncbi:MAG TPA: hypothetical protein VJM31_00915 [Vicinamibacterales bacterium]|nr:hypothetical protein [Vicinamibacterales bacterium]